MIHALVNTFHSFIVILPLSREQHGLYRVDMEILMNTAKQMKHQDLTVIKANCLVLTSAMCRCWCQTSSVDWAFLTSSSFTLICRSVTANFRCICLPHGTTSPATVLNKLKEHSGECIWPTTSNPNIGALAWLSLQNSSPPNMTVYVKWCRNQKVVVPRVLRRW